eukprot:scaffold7052_cov254-Pinguiococcus_pyrenoidosus.AAC.93
MHREFSDEVALLQRRSDGAAVDPAIDPPSTGATNASGHKISFVEEQFVLVDGVLHLDANLREAGHQRDVDQSSEEDMAKKAMSTRAFQLVVYLAFAFLPRLAHLPCANAAVSEATSEGRGKRHGAVLVLDDQRLASVVVFHHQLASHDPAAGQPSSISHHRSEVRTPLGPCDKTPRSFILGGAFVHEIRTPNPLKLEHKFELDRSNAWNRRRGGQLAKSLLHQRPFLRHSALLPTAALPSEVLPVPLTQHQTPNAGRNPPGLRSPAAVLDVPSSMGIDASTSARLQAPSATKSNAASPVFILSAQTTHKTRQFGCNKRPFNSVADGFARKPDSCALSIFVGVSVCALKPETSTSDRRPKWLTEFCVSVASNISVRPGATKVRQIAVFGRRMGHAGFCWPPKHEVVAGSRARDRGTEETLAELGWRTADGSASAVLGAARGLLLRLCCPWVDAGLLNWCADAPGPAFRRSGRGAGAGKQKVLRGEGLRLVSGSASLAAAQHGSAGRVAGSSPSH